MMKEREIKIDPEELLDIVGPDGKLPSTSLPPHTPIFLPSAFETGLVPWWCRTVTRPKGLWHKKPVKVCGYLEIQNVIFNDPATIVFWSDGSKTVVKCQPGDTYSKELGLAMAIAKKSCGNSPRYNKLFKKWVKDDG